MLVASPTVVSRRIFPWGLHRSILPDAATPDKPAPRHRGCIPFFWLDLSCCLHWCKNLWWNHMWNPCFCRHLSVSSIPDIYLIWNMAMVPPFRWFSNLHKSLEDFPMRAAGLITLMSIGFKTEIRPVNGRAEKAAHIKGTSTCGVRHVLFVGQTKM